MPTLSQYWFEKEFFAGPFGVFNEPYPLGGWAWISNGGSSQSTLCWNREDSEQVVDFGQVVSNSIVVDAVDGMLTGDIERTSALMANGVFWPDVPYYSKNPGAHSNSDMLVRVYFNFQINTPWYCSNADGWIGYYLFFYLDGSGALHGNVDGWAYDYSGGGPFCTGSIDDGLNNALPPGMSTLQKLLNEAIALDASANYSTLYFLPGNGTRSQGGSSQDADTDVALALVPR